MNKEELLKRYTEALMDMTNSGMDIERMTQAKVMFACYLRMFHEIPHCISTDYEEAYACIDTSAEDFKLKYEDMDSNATLKNIADNNAGACVCIRSFDIRIVIFDHMIMTCDEDSIYGCCNEVSFPEKLIMDNMVKVSEEDKRYMSYVTSGGNGFNTMSMEVHKQECDLESNYNDDLPDEQINNFIEGEESGIMILHGIPGCGKTSYLRHLIYSSKKHFMFLDSSVFNAITDASFVKLLIEHKNAVIVLEDCETLLEDRVRGNGKISALLNLSDGILGDSLNLKFICTFNADLTKIDQALLRKGRMKLKYEFKALTVDKAIALGKKLGKEITTSKPMALCDVYNYGEENGAKEVNSKKPIGFGV